MPTTLAAFLEELLEGILTAVVVSPPSTATPTSRVTLAPPLHPTLDALSSPACAQLLQHAHAPAGLDLGRTGRNRCHSRRPDRAHRPTRGQPPTQRDERVAYAPGARLHVRLCTHRHRLTEASLAENACWVVLTANALRVAGPHADPDYLQCLKAGFTFLRFALLRGDSPRWVG
ncbi:hypothetical protein C8R44DRAFT_275540 [Mycena epipterygia]|nr:hypothetical protein C8R44DRAFT_275540 [Mycena epipterygia]